MNTLFHAYFFFIFLSLSLLFFLFLTSETKETFDSVVSAEAFRTLIKNTERKTEYNTLGDSFYGYESPPKVVGNRCGVMQHK